MADLIINVKALEITESTVYVSDVVKKNENDGIATFNLHVEGSPFVGYLCTRSTNYADEEDTKTITYRINNTIVTEEFLPNTAEGTTVFNNTPITLPVGVYTDGLINIDVNFVSLPTIGSAAGGIGLSPTIEFSDVITETFVRITRAVIG